jgi:hypothetical protein
MEGESPRSASTPTGAVFLSYASQDAEAARRICEALQAAGIEVWFDQSELRGGVQPEVTLSSRVARRRSLAFDHGQEALPDAGGDR